jgi:hypothetical protein
VSLPARVLPEPERRRLVPKSFGWIDHRLVRDGHVSRCGTPALALYLVLVTVADAEGLSFYSDGALCRMLRWPGWQLPAARRDLRQAGLVAYQAPFYQVLSLDPISTAPPVEAGQRPPGRSPQAAERPATPEEVSGIIAEWKRRHGYA